MALVAVGLATSYYLLRLDLEVAIGPGGDVCAAVFGSSCEGALLSEWATVLGMPLAGWGLVYFAVLGMLLALGWMMGDGFDPEATVAVFLLSLAGLAGSAVLAAELTFGDTPLCPLCMVVHVINLALPAVIAARMGGSPLLFAGGVWRRWQASGEERQDPFARWRALGLLTVALFGIVVYQYAGIQVAEAREPGSASAARALADEIMAAEPVAIPVGMDDPILGRPDAPVKMVIFSDFECPACRNFAIWSRELKEEFGDDVAFVFKHFPLSDQCNPIMRSDMHPLSCPAAAAAEAARRQGKFWEYHDALYEAGLENGEQLAEVARAIGLDPAQMHADLQSQEVARKVRRDIDLALDIKVDSTPAVYWNGRRVRRLSLPLARILMQRAENTS